MTRRASLAVLVLTVAMTTGLLQARSTTPGNVDVRTQIRHELNGLPYSTIWDWIEAEARPDGSVVLRGEVMKPSTKDDAEFRVRRIESVQNVINEIHVLPLSTFDNEIRMRIQPPRECGKILRRNILLPSQHAMKCRRPQ